MSSLFQPFASILQDNRQILTLMILLELPVNFQNQINFAGMTKLRISEILCNIFFQVAVSALFWQSQFCTSKKIGFFEYSKIRNFVTYQTTFLLTFWEI